MNSNPEQNTGDSLQWFTQNLPTEYLDHPEQYLYTTAVETEQLKNTADNRRRFKALLVERKMEEGIDFDGLSQEQISDFMNPSDLELKIKRSYEFTVLFEKHLSIQKDFTQASRLAFLELFHKEAPFQIVEMDENYFTNRELVYADLHAFLQETDNGSLLDLHTKNPKQSISVLTQSGEKVKWQAYLNRASSVLFGTKAGVDNPHRRPEVLKKLLQIIDVDVPEYVPMDEAYFNNPKYVKADLNSFLKKAKGDSLNDLNTKNPKRSTSVLTNSSEEVRWETYLHRASGAILGTTFKKDNFHRGAEVLKKLLRIVDPTLLEYIPMDAVYFTNPKYVQADLNAFLQKAKGDSLNDLTTTNPKWSTSIITQNGEKVIWNTYLKRASGVLLGTKNVGDNPHRKHEALKKLLRIADPTIPEIIPMDEAYFTNPKYVQADLNSFLQKVKGDSLNDLTTGNPERYTSIFTQSGEMVKWETYLKRASGVLLGTKKEGDNLHRPPKALKKLLRIADPTLPEYIPMDEAYFNNPEYVKADLNSFLQKTDNGSLLDLTTRNPKPSTSILTQSGESIKWQTYLRRVSGVLLGTKTRGGNSHRPSEALKKLLRIADPTLPEYIPMDEAYFTNPEYVQADLNSFLQETDNGSLLDLHTANPKPSTSTLTQSGERVTWTTYLKRASCVLFGTKYVGDNRHRPSEAIKKLITIAQNTNEQ